MIIRVGKRRKDGKYLAGHIFDNGVRINKVCTRDELDAQCARGVTVHGYAYTGPVEVK